MNKLINLTNLNGYPFTQNTLEFMQGSFHDAFAGIAKMCGDKVIVSGMEITGSTIADGWLTYNGELVPFIGGTLLAGVVIDTTTTDKPFEDGIYRPALVVKTAQCGSPATFPFSDLVRLSTLKEVWQTGDLKQVHCNNAYIIANFESSGLGKNKRKGWAICNGANGTEDMRGLFAVGYDNRTVDPANLVWDLAYSTMLSTGGEKRHVLNADEMPNHTHQLFGNSHNANGAESDPNKSVSRGNGDIGSNSYTLFASDENATIGKSSEAGNNEGHENRPPFKVTLYIQKL